MTDAIVDPGLGGFHPNLFLGRTGCVSSTRGHDDTISSVAFSPDGDHLVAGSSDGTVGLWAVDPLPIARERIPRALTAEEQFRYRLPEGK